MYAVVNPVDHKCFMKMMSVGWGFFHWLIPPGFKINIGL